MSSQQNLRPGLAILNNRTTHNTRQRVFLCVMPAHIQIMVAQVGQLSGWPVSFGTGIANPTWATTHRDSQLWW
ncbi:ash family protein [Pectobacterium aroidearum]|uniref:Ash family protein n=1 Tax=Pectobacterium aroidearum TaxID=1201031 RepID=A0ABR5ZJH1_9GAMM|nr:ash family protein [Pectobacterium aroidearum]MBA5739911.1 ash family protein [Pectobacterium aroidearum]